MSGFASGGGAPVSGEGNAAPAEGRREKVVAMADYRRGVNVRAQNDWQSALRDAGGVAVAAPLWDSRATEAARRLHGDRVCYRFIKRAFDIAFSIAVLVLFWWAFALIAIAIKIDDPHAPVFFVQERVGKDGATFRMHKFRSMVVDAEERLEELRMLNEKTGPVFKMADDPRVTRVGRFLRKASLDELPQFWDVLCGHMSVVGPRPALPREVKAYSGYQRQRLLVKPGITCYWQTRLNRDSITFDEWVDLDLRYIERCSVWADFKLVVQTVGVVLMGQGS